MAQIGSPDPAHVIALERAIFLAHYFCAAGYDGSDIRSLPDHADEALGRCRDALARPGTCRVDEPIYELFAKVLIALDSMFATAPLHLFLEANEKFDLIQRLESN